MIDCRIVGGMVVDGTGTAARRCDVEIRDGRIVGLGSSGGRAARTIDADGRVVAPGFVDVHTHYDAQIVLGSRRSTSSSLHGVTTVIGGNCGFTLAPLGRDDDGYIMRMMARVEGIPVEALAAGLDLGWQTFGE